MFAQTHIAYYGLRELYVNQTLHNDFLHNDRKNLTMAPSTRQ